MTDLMETNVDIEIAEQLIESSRDPRLAERNCPICQSDYFRTYALCPPDDIGIQLFMPGFQARVVKCLVCGMVYTNPILSEELSNTIYTSTYAKLPPPHTRLDLQTVGIDSFLLGLLRRDHLLAGARMKKLFPDGGARVLDVGCSYGEFVHYLNNNGFSANGIDIIAPRIETGKALYGIEGITCGDLKTVEVRQYDIINLSHVIEHIGALDAFLERLVASMKTGAYLFVSVPNFAALKHLHHRRKLLFPYAHVNNFTYRHLVALFDRLSIQKVALMPISGPNISAADEVKERLNSVTSRILGISPFNLMFIGRVS